jgi:hypothetical protein
MTPAPEPKKQVSECTTDTQLDAATLSPVDTASDEQKKLWDAYREQQRRRSCPGCGDDGGLI